jgi:hypothetical protein
MSRPRIELSGLQASASAMAAVTGAVLASFLGVAGTIVGTAVASFAGTAGAAIYNHYLRRTKDRLGPVIAARAHQWTPSPYGVAPGEKQADEAKAGAGAAALTGFEESAPEADEEGDATAETAPEADVGKVGRRQWLVYGGTAAGIFILVMAGITVFELLTGKPISATVWHHSGSGTTVSSVVSGHNNAPAAPQPTSTATRQAQSTATPAPATSATATSPASPATSASPTVPVSPSVPASPGASPAG